MTKHETPMQATQPYAELRERLLEGARSITNDGTPSQVGPTCDDLCEAAEAISTLLDRCIALKEALEPFAAAAEDLDDAHKDYGHLWEAAAAMSLTAGDLRRACAALGDAQ